MTEKKLEIENENLVATVLQNSHIYEFVGTLR
jgi:hypothetical protein